MGAKPVSSWSENGTSIPFVPLLLSIIVKLSILNLWHLYKLSLEQTEYVKKAEIKVENINGPILLLAAKADSMWPSAQMAEMVIKRLDENKFPYWYKLYSYDDAGHSFHNKGDRYGCMAALRKGIKMPELIQKKEFLIF